MASSDLGDVWYLGKICQVKNDEDHGSKGSVGFMPGNKLYVKRWCAVRRLHGGLVISVSTSVSGRLRGQYLGVKSKNVFECKLPHPTCSNWQLFQILWLSAWINLIFTTFIFFSSGFLYLFILYDAFKIKNIILLKYKIFKILHFCQVPGIQLSDSVFL